MIRQFRRKLTCTALLTLTVMLALMVGAINLVNALTVRAQICSSLEMLVTGSVITVSLFRQGRHWRVCVHNTGSYISPKEQAHVFDRFYRADTSRSRENGGSGLGLAIAQQIAALHHTQITLKSDVNDGTAFSVSLPDGTEK